MHPLAPPRPPPPLNPSLTRMNTCILFLMSGWRVPMTEARIFADAAGSVGDSAQCSLPHGAPVPLPVGRWRHPGGRRRSRGRQEEG
jgi:hypothetical protein